MPSSNTTSRPAHQRHRSASDPFLDPIYPAPYLPYKDETQLRSAPLPPQLPPKQQYVKKSRHYTDARDPRMLEAAVRDAVTVRPVDSPRAKMGRSQTGGVTTTASGSKSSPVASRRSYSQDSVTQAANAVEKARKGKGKKGSTHADVIDRLDFTSVGPMFHHDGPFDACAPSRNRHKAKAPMLAWSSAAEEEAPMSAAQLRADRRLNALGDFGGSTYDSPYPTVAYPSADQYGSMKNSKQVDRIAEAWGIHEPEPYEEFFGGGVARANGEPASNASSTRGSMDVPNGRQRTRDGREMREQFREYLDESRPQQVRKNTARNLPPPQPLNLPGATAARPATADAYGTSPPSSPGFGQPKRSKSIMQKFRKMRDAPNVPVDAADGEDEGSPTSSTENYTNGTHGTGASVSAPENGRVGRPSHRHQNSFFGKRFGRNTSAHGNPTSPTGDANEQVLYVEKSANKALPPRPADAPITPNYDNKEDYFDAPVSPGGTAVTPGGGVGRKASLLKKVKGVVRGTGQK